MVKENKRELWIDLSKVVLIYLMVVAHTGHISKLADTIICGFHMPAFFIISGYLMKPKSLSWSTLKSLVLRIVVPIVFYYSLLWLIDVMIHVYHGNFDINDLLYKPLNGFIIRDCTIATNSVIRGLWFLQVLFASKLLLEIVLYYVKNNAVIIGFALLLIAVLQIMPDACKHGLYYPQRLLASIPFMLFGYYMKKYEWVENCKSKGKLFLSLLFAVIYVLVVLYNGRCGIHSWRFGYGYALFFVQAVVGSLSLFLISMLVYVKNLYFVLFLSVNTLSVLCLHRLFMRYTYFIPFGFFQGLVILLLQFPIIYLFNRYIPILIGNKRK